MICASAGPKGAAAERRSQAEENTNVDGALRWLLDGRIAGAGDPARRRPGCFHPRRSADHLSRLRRTPEPLHPGAGGTRPAQGRRGRHALGQPPGSLPDHRGGLHDGAAHHLDAPAGLGRRPRLSAGGFGHHYAVRRSRHLHRARRRPQGPAARPADALRPRSLRAWRGHPRRRRRLRAGPAGAQGRGRRHLHPDLYRRHHRQAQGRHPYPPRPRHHGDDGTRRMGLAAGSALPRHDPDHPCRRRHHHGGADAERHLRHEQGLRRRQVLPHREDPSHHRRPSWCRP